MVNKKKRVQDMQDIIKRIGRLFGAMEREYDALALHYGFTCRGCAENCCAQRFFHYTAAEHVFLREGLRTAPKDSVRGFIARSREVVAQYEDEVREGALRPLMCPLNEGGLCAVYSHRPMICRLHGLPHTFKRPDGRVESSGGCEPFNLAHPTPDRLLDRTRYYMELARIEGDLRQRLKNPARFRLTTAQMLIQMSGEDPAFCG